MISQQFIKNWFDITDIFSQVNFVCNGLHKNQIHKNYKSTLNSLKTDLIIGILAVMPDFKIVQSNFSAGHLIIDLLTGNCHRKYENLLENWFSSNSKKLT